MEKAFTVQLTSYAPLLKREGIRFREEEKSLTTGQIQARGGYVLFISCRTLDTPAMLQAVLPVLKGSDTAFRLIKNQLLQYRLNAGAFGDEEAGKVVSVFPCAVTEAIALAAELCRLTASFKGPVVAGAQRIGTVVYVQQVHQGPADELLLAEPDHRHFPFPVPRPFGQKKKRTVLLGRYFLPVQLLRSSAKGNIYKAINLRRLSFTWCLVKQGNPVALDDHFDRDMKDRLQWQRQVLNELSAEVLTPAVIDFFEQDESSYLVLQYAEGESLHHLVKEQLNGKQWKALDSRVQQRLLNLYLQALTLVSRIHHAGYVHRDITDSNFLVGPDGTVCVIDFELSYSLKRKQPNPPFLLGTFGYAAPEQLEHALPDEKEDVYSLGALLAFVLTGCSPQELITPDQRLLRTKLLRLTGCAGLTDLIIRCLHGHRKHRPELDTIQQVIQTHLYTLNPNPDEKITMAG